MCEHVLRVKTFRMNGLLSPRSWETWSTDGHLPRENAVQLTLPCYHVCDLDYWIDLRLRKNAFAACTLDIEAKDPQRGECRPLPFGSMGDKCVPAAFDL